MSEGVERLFRLMNRTPGLSRGHDIFMTTPTDEIIHRTKGETRVFRKRRSLDVRTGPPSTTDHDESRALKLDQRGTEKA